MKIKFLIFTVLISFTGVSAQSVIFLGGGEMEMPEQPFPCLTKSMETDIVLKLEKNMLELKNKGLLPNADPRQITLFDWPMRPTDNFDQFNYYDITNYVDLDPTSNIQDYNCGSRSYDGHNGLDVSLWPFWWRMMDLDQVEIVAGAPGIIIAKDDGRFDRNCSCIGNWNAVYVRHADGSQVWYGHLKTGSLTDKGVGDNVETGDYIGLVGSSGCSSNPHLHFEVRDATNKVIEPYQGPCNMTTPDSWWANQKPYRESKLNAIFTHTDAPEISGFCPGDEIPNISNDFQPGEVIYFSASYYSQDIFDGTVYSITDPDGVQIDTWTHVSPTSYSRSWWWWSIDMPVGITPGLYTFSADYENQVHEHQFNVGSLTSINNPDVLNLKVFPNPVKDFLYVDIYSLGDTEFSIFDVNGKIIKSGIFQSADERIDFRNLAKGVYLISFLNTNGSNRSLKIFKI